MTKVIVVGGGFAGVSAATALAEKGIPVELLESRGSLGGRVYSTHPSDTFPAPVDNGPHLLMGCYYETWRLFHRLGETEGLQRIYPLAVQWLAPGGKLLSLRGRGGMGVGFLLSNAFPFREKIKMLPALGTLVKKTFPQNLNGKTVGEFLELTQQGPLSRERFWNPLCRSVMNVDPEAAPLYGFAEVIRRVFTGSPKNSAFYVPSKPLSEIVFPRVGAYLEKMGGKLILQEGIQSFQANQQSFEVKSRTEKLYTGDALIWAVPPTSLSLLWPQVETIPNLGKSPIVSVHVIISKTILQGHFVGLPGAKFEWVFNRNANWGWKSPIEGQAQYLSFTASAAAELSELKNNELIDLAMSELKERCPPAKDAILLHSKVTREMAATFTWTLETDALRPPCETAFPNVFLAGDWTATGLPATIEGACLSGQKAAEKVEELLRKK